jgi:hypothetical protein
MRTTLFCSAVDVIDGGAAAVLSDARDRAGVDGLSIATSYHAARDLHPHARGSRVRHLEPGLWLPVDARLWASSPIAPQIACDAETSRAFTALVQAAQREGGEVDGWTVFLHTDRQGEAAGIGAERNVFGDVYREQLCPAQPETRAYAQTLARAVVQAGMPTVLAESLHYHGLEHGLHHERFLFEPGQVVRFLLGLCFCDACCAAAALEGVDSDRFRGEVARIVQETLDTGEPAPGSVATLAAAGELVDGAMAAWLRARLTTVTTLIAEVATACRAEGGGLVVLDSSGAAKGYSDGDPQGDVAPTMAWRFGLDIAAISAHCAVEAIAYARSPARITDDLAAYRGLIGETASLGAIVRPFGVDCSTVENLAQKLDTIRAVGAERADFYHYGLMPLPTLDRIRAALHGC